jgi:hypothetical protein
VSRILIDGAGRRVVVDSHGGSFVYDVGVDGPVGRVEGDARALSPDGTRLVAQAGNRLVVHTLP